MTPSRVLVYLVLILGCANAKTRPESRLTFTDSEKRFTFTYPESAVVFTSQNMREAQTQLPSYIPICDEGAVVCVGYPPSSENPDALSTFDGTNFEQASFQVFLLPEAKSASRCEVPKIVLPDEPDFRISTDAPFKTINGVKFSRGTSGAAAAGNQVSRELYRIFHAGKCYQLSLSITMTSIGNYDPGTIKEFTSADRERVLNYLRSILKSFRFTDTSSPLH
jgi:hypothetical protein